MLSDLIDKSFIVIAHSHGITSLAVPIATIATPEQQKKTNKKRSDDDIVNGDDNGSDLQTYATMITRVMQMRCRKEMQRIR